MPILDRIQERMADDPEWTLAGRNARRASRDIAQRMPLVHVTGSRFPFISLFSDHAGSIPTSDARGYVSPGTRDKEAEFNFSPCVYFYPGRAHQDYGQVALAFEPAVEDGCPGSCTLTGYYAVDNGPPLPCNDRSPHPNGTVRQDYIAKSTADTQDQILAPPWPTNLVAEARHDSLWSWLAAGVLWLLGRKKRLPRWRAVYAKFLEAYFPQIHDYWHGTPFRPDFDGIFDTFNDPDRPEWRAWTPEVRLHGPIPLDAVAAWCPSETYRNIMDMELRKAVPINVESFERFLDSHPPLAVTNGYRYDKEIERWCQEYCRIGGSR